MYKWIRHNQGTTVGLVICVILMFWTYGCQSTVMSPISGNKVTRSQLKTEVHIKVQDLEREIEKLQERAQAAYTTLDRQDEIKRKLYAFASISAQQGTFNPTGIITLVGSILAGGLAIDNRRKDTVIKNRPNTAKTTNTG